MALHPLSELIALVRERSPFYRDLYSALPSGESRLERLPPIDQEKFWAAQSGKENRLLTAPLSDAIVFKSGGTTGNPKFSVFSREEWHTFTRVFGRGMSQGAIEAGDRVGNLFYAGELYASFLFIHGSLERATQGAVNFPLAGTTAPATVAKTIDDFSINVLAGVPTTLLSLAEGFLKTGKRLSSVKKVIFGGESMYPDQRDLLERAFPGVRIVSIGYASVDAGLLGYADSACRPGEHRAFSPETLLEILSEDTGEPIHEPGRPGKLLITNFTRTLMPILRYPCGDRAQWIESAGAPNRKFLLLGRSEEGARVGPVTLYYEDARLVLDRFRVEGAIRAFQLVVERVAGKDALTLRISTPSPGALSPTLGARVLEALHECRPMLRELAAQGKVAESRLEWVEPQKIAVNPRTGKLKRVLDLRT